MPKCCPANEKVKRDYAFFLEAANGKQSSSVDAALRAIHRFEEFTGFKPFSKFRIEQARAFRGRLLDAKGPNGKPLSSSTITATLKHLRNFFVWLSQQPGFRSKLNPTDAAYFTPSDQDLRISSARRDRPVPTVEEIKHVLSLMTADSQTRLRDRALIAFVLLTGARDGAVIDFRLKHLNLVDGTLFQDAREVRTKGRKTFTSNFFPVGPEPVSIVSDYVEMLRNDLGFGPDDPLFCSTLVGKKEDHRFTASGLSREPWRTAEPIRQIFREAFARAGLPYANPHAIRKTLVQLGQRLCQTPEQWKAWSQNLGHESEATTFVGYGQVSRDRQSEILRSLGKPVRRFLSSETDLERELRELLAKHAPNREKEDSE